MALDPRAPVIIGVGQTVQHTDDLDEALDPSLMMCSAIGQATVDAGLRSIPNPQSLRVVNLLTWKYGDPAFLIAQQLGLTPNETVYTTMGGQSPQSLVNATAAEIQAGTLEIAILAGGEARRTRVRARKAEVELRWPTAPEGHSPRIFGEDLVMNHPSELERGVMMPVQIYPIFESAIRAASGLSPEQHLIRISELWSRFSEVASDNPSAWSRKARTAEEIRTPSSHNRMIGLPYTKYMNSNNDVDMAAALIVCSVEKATSMGVPRDRWVFIHSGTDCHEHQFVSNRWSFADTPAIELGGRRVMELAGCTIDDVSLVDLYSCFPSAVQLGAQSLGLSLDRQLTRTGGLAFAGGPWNNYVMHAIATMVGELRGVPGELGLVWANGGYATKHAFGIYSTAPSPAGFRSEHPQDEVDALPRRDLAEPADAAGPATIEAYTVMHSRDGWPETAIAACLLADGRRAWGMSSEPGIAGALCEGEWVGTRVVLTDTGMLHVDSARQ
jgi:acetyl-CoA C-acetyltransferase